jgi:L-amino acid N-acyltransferase YncA
MIRDIRTSDIGTVTSIYNHYIENSIVTFEEEPLSPDIMGKRIEVVHENYPWIVYGENGNVLGYAYASRFRERAAYRYSAGITVYVDRNHTGKGIGTGLYKELLHQVNRLELKAVYGCIALPNPGSVRLHEKFGFSKVAHLTNVGFKFGRWLDVGYWELQLGEKDPENS